MAITIDQIVGLDIAFFGEPFVYLKNSTVGSVDGNGLDLSYFGEPFYAPWNIPPVGGVSYDATKMFLMF